MSRAGEDPPERNAKTDAPQGQRGAGGDLIRDGRDASRCRPRATVGWRLAGGFSAAELCVVLALSGVVAALSYPALDGYLEETRTRGAVRWMTTRLAQARTEAVSRSANVGVRFDRERGHEFTVVVDGNRNGVLADDIAHGLDVTVNGPDGLASQFPGVHFALNPGVPPMDREGQTTAPDPVRAGGSDMIVFTPEGTATPASLYIRGLRSSQYVVRIAGDTGRVRALRFHAGSRQWLPM